MVIRGPKPEAGHMENRAMNAPLQVPRASMGPGLVRLRRSGWLIFLVVGLGAALLGAFNGDEGTVRPLLTLLGLAATAAVLIGAHQHRPAKLLPWRLLAGCTLATTVGGVLVPMAGGLAVFGQLSTVGGSVAGMVGFIMLIRGRIPAAIEPPSWTRRSSPPGQGS
jgi:hypothetical membrane protein